MTRTYIAKSKIDNEETTRLQARADAAYENWKAAERNWTLPGDTRDWFFNQYREAQNALAAWVGNDWYAVR